MQLFNRFVKFDALGVLTFHTLYTVPPGKCLRLKLFSCTNQTTPSTVVNLWLTRNNISFTLFALGLTGAGGGYQTLTDIVIPEGGYLQAQFNPITAGDDIVINLSGELWDMSEVSPNVI